MQKTVEILRCSYWVCSTGC